MSSDTQININELDEIAVLAIFNRTLTEDLEADGRWEAIRLLQNAGERSVFDQAVAWCKSSDIRKQISGVDILAQIGKTAEHHKTKFADESYPLIVDLLKSCHSNALKDSAISALHHLENPLAIPLICSFCSDSDAEIRLAVAHALGFPFANDALSVDALLKLMQDESQEVRDWATFGLGAQGDADSAEIREALVKRLSVTFADAREEAISALSKRKDLRALSPLIDLLQTGNISFCIEEAALSLLDMEIDGSERTTDELLAALKMKFGADCAFSNDSPSE